MPRRRADHMEAQRERILRATIRCVGDLGLDGTSIAEIGRAAGLSTGALYTHFAGKDAIVAAALRFAAADNEALPPNWSALKASVAGVDDQMGFDTATIARARLQLLAGSVRPGPLHDMLRSMFDTSLAAAARHLQFLQDAGEITLRMSPVRTATSISAVVDGLTWIGLANDRPREQVVAEIHAALDCLVELPATKATEPG